MRVLVIDYQHSATDRNTITDHLRSFQRYSDHQVLHVNAAKWWPSLIHEIPFDVIIYHYTFLSCKWNGKEFFDKVIEGLPGLKELKGYSVAIPQDEYVNSEVLEDFFLNFGVQKICTCLEKSEWEKVYPRSYQKGIELETVLTGYIDEKALKKILKISAPFGKREFDIGYRARHLPFWLGEHGTLKWKLTDVFNEACKGTHFRTDLSNRYEDVFLGDQWYHFLKRCRTVLSCEGGASLHDPDGKIRDAVEKYVKNHPEASFEEVRDRVFPGRDGNLKLFAISPRHFEACMTKTTQVMIEGEYFGIFKPGIHFIEVKKDFSNLREVLSKIENLELCEQIAENCYKDIVLSEKYTYRAFVSQFFNGLNNKIKSPQLEVSKEIRLAIQISILDLLNSFLSKHGDKLAGENSIQMSLLHLLKVGVRNLIFLFAPLINGLFRNAFVRAIRKKIRPFFENSSAGKMTSKFSNIHVLKVAKNHLDNKYYSKKDE